MIFKTYKNDLDGITNKLGFSKRSFAEWGTQVKTAFKDGTTKVESFKNALSAMFTVQKEKSDTWIKNLTGDIVTSQNIDTYLSTINDTEASSLLKSLQDVQKQVNAGTISWDDYFKNCKGGKKYLIDFVQNTNLQTASTQDLVKANKQAREAAIAHNAALQQQTLGAKAATVATKALAIAGNMIAMWAVTKGIELLSSAIDSLIETNEEYLEKQDEIISKNTEEINSIENQITSLKELKEKLDVAKDSKVALINLKIQRKDGGFYNLIKNLPHSYYNGIACVA